MDSVEWRVPKGIKKSHEVKKRKKWYLNVDKKKASGGFGTVYSGNLSRWRVLKSLIFKDHVKVAVKEQDVESHEHEVNMLRQLSHPNIVPLLGDYVENDRGFLVVPMYESNLKEWSGECHGILLDVSLGLEYLNDEGIVHCDIKPGNICVRLSSQGPEGVIIDFGVAKKNGEDDRGVTPEYLNAYFKWNLSNSINVEYLDHRYDLFCLSVVAGNVDSSDKELCLELKDLLENEIKKELKPIKKSLLPQQLPQQLRL